MLLPMNGICADLARGIDFQHICAKGNSDSKPGQVQPALATCISGKST